MRTPLCAGRRLVGDWSTAAFGCRCGHEPIKIYQVEADGLAGKFPPLRRDVDPSARTAEAEVRGWDEAWARSKAVGH